MSLLGIDIGGTRLKCGLVSDSGTLLHQHAVPTPLELEAFRNAIRALVTGVMTHGSVEGIGFGCKGLVDFETTRVLNLPGAWSFLEGLRLDEMLEGLVAPGTPVAGDNDAKASLAGESRWGAARGKQDALLLTLGTGVGGAVLSGGHLLRGAAGLAGHLGHMTVEPDGLPCLCGNIGCLETVFSARAVESSMRALVHQGVRSPLCDAMRDRAQELTAQMVFEAAAQGDAMATALLQRKIHLLAGALTGMIHAFDPEVVILSGSMVDAGPVLFDPLREEVYRRTSGLVRRQVPIIPTALSDPSGIIGAAALL